MTMILVIPNETPPPTQQEGLKKLRADLVADLTRVYNLMCMDEVLHPVAFGITADYLCDVYGLTYDQASKLIQDFPKFMEIVVHRTISKSVP